MFFLCLLLQNCSWLKNPVGICVSTPTNAAHVFLRPILDRQLTTTSPWTCSAAEARCMYVSLPTADALGLRDRVGFVS